MTPKEQKALTAAIQANRRTLSLLDRSMEEVVKTDPAVLLDHDIEYHQPFFYGAVGADGKLGMPISNANLGENPSFGYIRMQPDSAFVTSRINASVIFELVFPNPSSFCSAPTGLSFGPTLGLRMYDESSSRWITFTNRNNEPQQKTTLSFNVFSPIADYNEGGIDTAIECVFPRSAVVRVEAYLLESAYIPVNGRVVVVFNGYKVYGG